MVWIFAGAATRLFAALAFHAAHTLVLTAHVQTLVEVDADTVSAQLKCAQPAS